MTHFNQQYFTDLKPIQTGSFSTVYRAWSSSLNQYVALKVIPKHKTSKKVLYNEVEIMRTLGNKHPNICQMLDFFEDDSNYILVLEYCEGGDLYDFLDIVKRQGKPKVPFLIKLNFQIMIKQLFSALYYAHSLGIAHRDIKPENILITKDGNIKLADWGHATFQETSFEFHIGTDNYRAPETFYHKDGYDTKVSDYWSLGVSILFLIFGWAPFKCAAINLDNIPVKYSKEMKLCSNFLDYSKNPYQFIDKYYLAPTLVTNSGLPYNYHNSRPILFVWEDLANISYMQRFSHIIVDTLITINITQRNFFKCIHLCDEFWSTYQQTHLRDQYREFHDGLRTRASSPDLQESTFIDSNTFSSNSHVSNPLSIDSLLTTSPCSSTNTCLDENNKEFCNNTSNYNSYGRSLYDTNNVHSYHNNTSFEPTTNITSNITQYASIYSQIA